MSYSPPILELPLHLLSMILAQLDSMQSLGSAILSHSLFYHSFHDDTKHIVQCILRNQIPPELMHYAATAFEAKFVRMKNPFCARTLLKSAFEGLNRPPNGVHFQEWYLKWVFDHKGSENSFFNASGRNKHIRLCHSLSAISTASVLSKTHRAVEYFCDQFLSERLPLLQRLVGRHLPGDGHPSRKELFRIRRALYRFQIYCNLVFRDDTDFHAERRVRQTRNFYLGDYFFGSFSPWVNEQLSCIHDYLEEVLSRAFDDVASHDIALGARSVDWLAQGRRNEYKQAYVSLIHSVSRNYQRLQCN